MVKQTVGIVLKEINTSNENDKIVVALTKEHGKKSFYFKNAKKKNYAATSLFSLSEFNFTSGKNFFNAKEVSLIESFYNIRSDVKKFAYASYMIEFISEFALEDVASDEILKFLYYTLNLLNKSFLNLELIKVVFEMKILQYAGIYPEFFNCIECSAKTSHFDFKKGGLLCEDCIDSNEHIITIKNGTIEAFKYIILSNYKEVFKFKVTDDIILEMKKVNRKFIDYHFDKNFKSLKFIEVLEGEM